MIFNDNMDEPDIIENINADMLVINDVDDNDKLVNKKPKKRRKNFQCPYEECDGCFVKNIRLQTHIRIRHTGYAPYECPRDNCRASFACQSYLNKHLRRHDKEPSKKSRQRREYACTECPELLFRNKTQLKQHQASVHNQMPFKCEHCERGFIVRSKLNAHRRRHRGYQCGRENCNYQTDKWTDLRKHLAKEHRKLECNVCMKTYSSSYHLRVHRQTAHPDESIEVPKFHCPHTDCDRSYTRSSSLRGHLLANHCDPKHCCSNCDKRFRHKKTLVAHLDRCHSSNSGNNERKKVISKKTSKIKLTKAKLDKLLRVKSLFQPKQSNTEETTDTDCSENINHSDGYDDNNDRIDYDMLAESNLMSDMLKTNQ
ncbi:transcription factor IIIA [Dermatophagoides farinae]|uniref:transcription factor IIIA n=1 Tax=Dermatophagoides farinae TaxID=6954 RepID=UPI003F621AB0